MTDTPATPDPQPTREAREIAETILWHGLSIAEAACLIDRFAAQHSTAASPIDDAALKDAVGRAICKSRTCEGVSCCQWPANRGRMDCPVDRGGYDDAAAAAISVMRERLAAQHSTAVSFDEVLGDPKEGVEWVSNKAAPVSGDARERASRLWYTSLSTEATVHGRIMALAAALTAERAEGRRAAPEEAASLTSEFPRE